MIEALHRVDVNLKPGNIQIFSTVQGGTDPEPRHLEAGFTDFHKAHNRLTVRGVAWNGLYALQRVIEFGTLGILIANSANLISSHPDMFKDTLTTAAAITIAVIDQRVLHQSGIEAQKNSHQIQTMLAAGELKKTKYFKTFKIK